MLPAPETIEFALKSCEKERYTIGNRDYDLIKEGLPIEDYEDLKKLDDMFFSCNLEHWFVNFLPDEERPKDVFRPPLDYSLPPYLPWRNQRSVRSNGQRDDD